MGEFAIGQPVPRFEDPRLVKGHGRYVADMVFPGMAFGYVLRSPHAHARIRSIDTAKAKSTPGVLAVLTSAEYKAAGFGDLPVPGGLKRRNGVPRFVRGNSHRRERLAVIDVRAESQHLLARVVMIGKLSGDFFNLNVVQAGRVQNPPRSRVPAHARLDLRSAGISRADPHLGDSGQQ